MVKDKYQAVWVSHSSISDFLKCPRLYYLRNVYKDPKTGHKITIIKPPLALGQAVHQVIEEISYLPQGERLRTHLTQRLDQYWPEVAGKKGGFASKEEEESYYLRAKVMLERVEKNPGPVLSKAVKIKADGNLPFYWLSEEDNLILSGKIDWIEYLPDDSIHIIDFKTGRGKEQEESLQLPIYYLLATNTQERRVSKISYWYLETDEAPRKMNLPVLNKAFEVVYDVAKRMKLGRQINYFKCPQGGCFACTPLERVLAGEGEKIGESTYRQDIYFLPV